VRWRAVSVPVVIIDCSSGIVHSCRIIVFDL
jgi:hypothetical protein